MQKRYKIDSIINNNFVASKKDGQEVIFCGRGIAFGKKSGNDVDEEKIEKIFIIEDEHQKTEFSFLTDTLPPAILELTLKVVKRIEADSEYRLETAAYMALADHIAFAAERYQSGGNLKNKLLNEIKRFYPDEMKLGENAVEVIFQETGMRFSEDEAGFIAIHLLNSSNSPNANGLEQLKMVEDIIQIIENYFEIRFDEESFYYQRLVTHLKYLVFRIFKQEQSENETDDFFYRISRIQYPRIHRCVNIIDEYMNYNYNIHMSTEEMGYLVIHLSALLKRKNTK